MRNKRNVHMIRYNQKLKKQLEQWEKEKQEKNQQQEQEKPIVKGNFSKCLCN